MVPTQYPSTWLDGVACLSSEGRKIDKFMSTARWRYAANPCLCLPRLRLRPAPLAQTHDWLQRHAAPLMGATKPVEMGLFRFLYGRPLLEGGSRG